MMQVVPEASFVSSLHTYGLVCCFQGSASLCVLYVAWVLGAGKWLLWC